MIKNWVKDRLVIDKRNSELWGGFVDAIQAVYEETVEPVLQRISNRKSFFTMNDEDITLRMSEYGRFFIVAETNESSRPVLLAQRLDEIHFKGTDRPITSTFWREFDNLPVTWTPLYAPVDQDKAPYGTFFTSKAGVEVAKEHYGEFFLTSRAQISIALNELYERYGFIEQSELVSSLLVKFDQIIQPLLPLHIVFDGLSLFISFDFSVEAERLQVVSIGIDYNAKMTYSELRSEISSLKVSSQQLHVIEPVPVPEVQICERYDIFAADAWWNDYRRKPETAPAPVVVADAGTDSRARLFSIAGVKYIGIQKGWYQGVTITGVDGTKLTTEFPFDGTPEFVVAIPEDEDGRATITQLDYVQFLP